MSRIRKATRDLEDLGVLVVKAMFLIVIIVLVAKALLQVLVSESLARWGSYIIGISSLFVIVVSKRVRREIQSFGKQKRR